MHHPYTFFSKRLHRIYTYTVPTHHIKFLYCNLVQNLLYIMFLLYHKGCWLKNSLFPTLLVMLLFPQFSSVGVAILYNTLKSFYYFFHQTPKMLRKNARYKEEENINDQALHTWDIRMGTGKSLESLRTGFSSNY